MDILKTLLEEFYAKLPGFAKINQRTAKLPKLKNKIKAIIGMRRTGKTYFVYQQIHLLVKKGIDTERMLYINFEDDRISPMSKREFAQLLDSFYSLYPDNHKQLCYFFLDEVQNVEEWSQVVRRFFDSKQVEIIISVSSSKLL